MRAPILALALLALVVQPASAQCPGWSTDFIPEGLDGSVSATLTADLGNGPLLIAAGALERAGTVPVDNIAAWDGASWSALGSGLPEGVDSLAVYDRGSGPELYAGLSSVDLDGVLFRLEGAQWVNLGFIGLINDMVVFDEGNGEELILAGVKINTPSTALTAYDGTQFRLIGAGVSVVHEVTSLEVWDDGQGPALYVAGRFDEVGQGLQVPVQNVARWDGVAWDDVSGGVEGEVKDMEAFDDGSGSALYLTGSISSAGGVSADDIVRLRGGAWEALPRPSAFEMTVLETPQGQQLFFHDSPLQRWEAGGYVVASPELPTFGPATLASYDSGAGLEIIAGLSSSLEVDALALRSGSWQLVGSNAGLSGRPVRHLEPLDVPGAAGLWAQGMDYVEGQFVPFNSIAIYDDAWSFLETGLQILEVEDLEVVDLGGGSRDVIVAGVFKAFGSERGTVGRYDGVDWLPLGEADVDDLRGLSLALFDGGQGPELFLGQQVGGIANNRALLRWTGTDWVSAGLGSGTFGGASVSDMVVFDDGSGPALYCAGRFVNAGGVSVSHIARWDGAQWSDVGGGFLPPSNAGGTVVFDLQVIDGPTGPALVAGGRFTSAGGQPISYLALWDGQGWSPFGPLLGGPASLRVTDLAWHDTGEEGRQLYALGNFTDAGGIPVTGVARFDGTSWQSVGAFDQAPDTLAIFEDSQGRGLFFGGAFQQVDNIGSSLIARLEDPCAPQLGIPFCSSTPNSSGSAAILRASGDREVSAADVTLRASNLPANTPSLMIYSLAPQDIPFDAGRLCLDIPIVRIQPPANSDALGRRDLTIDFNAPYAGAFVPGTSTNFQLWFRDPLGAGNSDLTDGLRIDWR